MAFWSKIRSRLWRAGGLAALGGLGALHCAPAAPPSAPQQQCVETRVQPAYSSAAPASDYAPLPATTAAVPAPAAPVLRVVPQVGHVGAIKRVGYTQGGRYLVSVADEIKLWDPPTGLLMATLQIPGESLVGFAVLPDNQRLIAGTKNGVISAFSIESGAQLATWQLPGGDWVDEFDVSPDGRYVVAGGRGAAVVLDLERNEIVKHLDTKGKPSQAAAYTPDGPVNVVNARGKLEVWDVERGRKRFTVSTIAEPAEVRFSADGDRMIVGLHGSVANGYALATQQKYEVHLYDTKQGRLLQALTGQTRAITDASLSLDGSRLAIITHHVLSVYDLKSGKVQNKLQIYPRKPVSVAFAPDGKELLVGGEPMNSTSPIVATYHVHASSLSEKQKFEGSRWLPQAGAFNGDGGRALIGSKDEEVTLWNTENGSVISSQRGSDDWYLMDVALADDGQHAVAGSPTRAVFWDLERGRQRAMPLGGLWTYRVGITPDGRRAVGCGYGSIMKTWDFDSGRALATVRVGNDPNTVRITNCAILPDGKRAVYIYEGARMRAVNAENGDKIHEFDDQGGILSVHPSRDGSLLVSAGQRLVLWQPDKREPLRILSMKASDVRDAVLTPDNKHVVSVNGSSVITVRDAQSGNVVRELRALTGQLTRVAAAPDGKRLIAASQDGSARLFDFASGHSMALVSSGREWLIFDDQGYFDASQRGGELVALVHAGRPFRIDQLAMRFNHPGRMLAQMGIGRGGVHEHFTAQYRRRLRRMNISETSLETAFAGAPQAQIASLDLANDGRSARLAFELKASGSGLAGYQVYANDVPLFGLGGRKLEGVAGGVFRGEEQIALVPGVNRIEVSALGGDGVQSFRELRKVQSVAAQPRDLYLLAFGVSRYANPAYDLGFAHKDALDLVEVASSMQGKPFGKVHAHAFVDEQVTVAQLRAAKQLLKEARPNDVVVVFVAGHGMYSRAEDARYFYLTHEADPQRLEQTAAPFELVEDLVQEIAPRQKLLLIDTCTSGERDEGEAPVAIPGGASARSRAIRGLVLARAGKPAPRDFLLHRDRFIYNDLLRRSGAIVISSSRGSELSFEDESIQNGYFTEEILRALTSGVADRNRDGAVSPSELSQHVQGAVAKATKGAQHPVVDHNNPTVEFAFPVVSAAAGVTTRAMTALPSRAPRQRGLELTQASPAPCVTVPATPRPPGCACRAAGAPSDHSLAALSLALLLARSRRRKGLRVGSTEAGNALGAAQRGSGQ